MNISKKLFCRTLLLSCCMMLLLGMTATAKPQKAPRKIVLSHKQVTLYEGQTKRLQVKKVKPSDASCTVRWKSKNPKIVSIDKKGKITALASGRANILAISKKSPRIKAVVKVTVERKPSIPEYLTAERYDISGGVHQMAKKLAKKWKKQNPEKYTLVQSKADFQSLKTLFPDASFLSEYKSVNYSKDALLMYPFSVNTEKGCSLDRFYIVKTLSGSSETYTGLLKINCLTESPTAVEKSINYMAVVKISKESIGCIDSLRCELRNVRSLEKTEKEFSCTKLPLTYRKDNSSIYPDELIIDSEASLRDFFDLSGIGTSAKSLPDFSKETLILLRNDIYRAAPGEIISCSTSLDDKGKLCCTIQQEVKKEPNEPDISYPTVMTPGYLVIKMNQDDVAMIDYFKIEQISLE